MVNFFKENQFIIFKGVEILAAVTGLCLYAKYKFTPAKYFIWFLVYVVFIENIGSYPRILSIYESLSHYNDMIQGTIFQTNRWWYTIFWSIGSILFFSFYYYKILINRLNKDILKISTILFVICTLVIILNNGMRFFNTVLPSISVLGFIIIIECVVFYFIETLNSDKILNFYKSLNFYISAVILIFWLVKTPLSFYEIYYRKIDMDYVNLRGNINLFIISFMYLTYTIGLIVSYPESIKKQ